MTVTVLLFGPYAKAAEDSCVRVDLSSSTPATAGQVMSRLAEQQPNLREILRAARLAVNCNCVGSDYLISEQDELAVIGMVGGG